MVGDPSIWEGFPPIPKYLQDHARRIALEKTMDAASEEITIRCNDSFECSADGTGAVLIAANDKPLEQRVDRFEMDFAIPCIEGKRTCMIRVNLEEASFITLHLAGDKEDAVLDTCFLPPGKRQSADFFVSLPASDPNVKILFEPRYPERGCTVKNIELWYY